jgi:hypothetical protein
MSFGGVTSGPRNGTNSISHNKQSFKLEGTNNSSIYNSQIEPDKQKDRDQSFKFSKPFEGQK